MESPEVKNSHPVYHQGIGIREIQAGDCFAIKSARNDVDARGGLLRSEDYARSDVRTIKIYKISLVERQVR